MFIEGANTELVSYISRLHESEQNSLLKQLKLREALLRARELDRKQKFSNNGMQVLSSDEIVSIVRNVRKKNAKSSA